MREHVCDTRMFNQRRVVIARDCHSTLLWRVQSFRLRRAGVFRSYRARVCVCLCARMCKKPGEKVSSWVMVMVLPLLYHRRLHRHCCRCCCWCCYPFGQLLLPAAVLRPCLSPVASLRSVPGSLSEETLSFTDFLSSWRTSAAAFDITARTHVGRHFLP